MTKLTINGKYQQQLWDLMILVKKILIVNVVTRNYNSMGSDGLALNVILERMKVSFPYVISISSATTL